MLEKLQKRGYLLYVTTFNGRLVSNFYAVRRSIVKEMQSKSINIKIVRRKSLMKNLKMLLVPGLLGMGLVLSGADAKSVTVPAPDAKAAGADLVAQMNQSKGTPVAEAFAFLPATVAEVNGKAVTKAEFIKAMAAQVPDGMIPAQMPLAMLKMQAPQLVEQYVMKMVLDKALEGSKIVVTEAEIAARIREEIAKMPRDQRNMINEMLKAQGKTIDDVIKMQSANKEAQKMMAFQKFMDSKTGKITVDPAEVEKFYKDNPKQFVQPGDEKDSIRASHILVKVDENADEKAWAKAKADIEDIIARLKKGADFGKLAAEKSACPSGKSANGSLGAFGKGQMVPEFEKAAYALKVGEISGAVKTSFGYHVIRRDASQKERTMSFAEVKDRLTAALLQQKQMEAANKVVQELMKAANVKILVKAELPPQAAPKAPAQAK